MISPKKIYLQVDPDRESACDWIDGVTWCEDKINDNDIEYVKADLHLKGFESFVRDRFKHIVDGKGIVIPRIAVNIALDDIFKITSRCDECDYKEMPASEGYCYMFREMPEDCAQFKEKIK